MPHKIRRRLILSAVVWTAVVLLLVSSERQTRAFEAKSNRKGLQGQVGFKTTLGRLFRNKRCVNCHAFFSGFDKEIDSAFGISHQGGSLGEQHASIFKHEGNERYSFSEAMVTGLNRCSSCHIPGWRAPAPHMDWTYDSLDTVCLKIKANMQSTPDIIRNRLNQKAIAKMKKRIKARLLKNNYEGRTEAQLREDDEFEMYEDDVADALDELDTDINKSATLRSLHSGAHSDMGHHLKNDPLIVWALIDGKLPNGTGGPIFDDPSKIEFWNESVDAWIDSGMPCKGALHKKKASQLKKFNKQKYKKSLRLKEIKESAGTFIGDSKAASDLQKEITRGRKRDSERRRRLNNSVPRIKRPGKPK